MLSDCADPVKTQVYCGIVSDTEWPARLTQAIAGEVYRYRKERGMSAQQLSAECARLGMEISRSTLADLENGRRAMITVAELLVLAVALEVPPIMLVVPVARMETVEVIPNRSWPYWQMALWFRGQSLAIQDLGEGPELISRATRPDTPLDRVEHHQSLVVRWSMADRDVRSSAAAVGRADHDALAQRRSELEGYQRDRDEIERELTDLRRRMRGDALVPPPLPPELAYIDQS